jgi:hypothetical protein
LTRINKGNKELYEMQSRIGIEKDMKTPFASYVSGRREKKKA